MRAAAPPNVPRETPPWGEEFAELLSAWNRRINLVSRGDSSRLISRHVQDSLELVPLIPEGVNRGVDLGSGAGFPGLILAKATGIQFDLIEADQRKAAFLREAVRLLRAPVAVHAGRAESVHVTPAPLVTARAVAPLIKLLPLAARFLALSATALFPKGPTVETELTSVEPKWQMEVERFPGRATPGAVVLRITELRRVGQFSL